MTKQFVRLALAAVTLSGAPVLLSPSVLAQAISVNGGSIGGTITDPSGAAISGASVSIVSTETGFKKDLSTDKAGYYQIGPLNPGKYDLSVTAPGFQTTTVSTVIRTGTATPGSFKLVIGQSSTEISVEAGAVQVNTDQGGVSDVITKEQINSLPINGRNFLDIAQIEPGVILQAGQSFDPTKAGYSAISVSGVSGRTTRILLDGQDITDETVGTTIFNVSQGAINEFQLNRSTQDVSGDVTSTGQVLVSTNSGTNAFHGQAFYNFQDARAGFATGAASNPPFQRNQFGGSLGGPIIKDKLFFFGNLERIKQDSSTQASLGTLFTAIQAAHPTFPTPYRETYSTIRLDYNGPLGGHYFVRANYNVNSVTSNGDGNGYQLYANRDNTPGLAGGADFSTGRFTHSFRGSYEKFHNLIGDNSGASGYNPLGGVAYQFSSQNLYFGPNSNAPQGTFQSDKQFRYDGVWTKGAHSIRYGYSLNRLQGGGYASFFGLGPYITTTTGKAIAGANPNDPINGYAVSSMYIGNGLGSFTERPAFGLPGGGTADWRQGAYISDNWKVTPSLTLIAGLRWSVDTDRANQDLATPTCASLSSTIANSGFAPCTGSSPLFEQFGTGLGKRVHQPWANFGPQLGFAFSPGNHKTVFRGAAGIFYENDVFNNTTNARNGLLAKGPFNYYTNVCTSKSLAFPDGTIVTSVNGRTLTDLCSSSVASAAPYALALENNFKAASAANPQVNNTGYVGNTLNPVVYGAPYRTPYAEQFNFGIQRELFKGAVLSADYVHNATLKIGQYVDPNHVGAARYFNLASAKAAIAAANDSVGCGATDIACGIAAGLTIEDYANNGLDSGAVYLNGQSATAQGYTPTTGAAFPGQNNLVGQGQFILPVGKSGYDALQMVFRQVANHPAPGIVSTNLQISYAFSRAINTSKNGTAGDAFFHNAPWDNDNPAAIMGRSGLDHTQQVNFGGSMRVKYGLQLGMIGHFYSAPPTNLTLDNSVLTAGNIFQSDLNGDGSTGDLLPGTNPGDYMHSVKSGNLQSRINTFNSTYAGKLTPAGQVLVNNGLFTAAQLTALNGTIRPIANLASPRAINNPAFRSLDVNVSYPISLAKVREGMSIEPVVAFYNVGNFSNFTSVGGVLNNIDEAAVVGGVNTNEGTRTGPNTYAVQNANRILRQSGTFAQGAPRTAEFQLKLNF